MSMKHPHPQLAGLREHDNFCLPACADMNDILAAPSGGQSTPMAPPFAPHHNPLPFPMPNWSVNPLQSVDAALEAAKVGEVAHVKHGGGVGGKKCVGGVATSEEAVAGAVARPPPPISDVARPPPSQHRPPR